MHRAGCRHSEQVPDAATGGVTRESSLWLCHNKTELWQNGAQQKDQEISDLIDGGIIIPG